MFCTWLQKVNGSQFPSISPPFVNPELLLLLSKESEFYSDMIEVLQRVPLRPFTIALHPFKLMSTFSGMWTFWWLRMALIACPTLEVFIRNAIPVRLMEKPRKELISPASTSTWHLLCRGPSGKGIWPALLAFPELMGFRFPEHIKILFKSDLNSVVWSWRVCFYRQLPGNSKISGMWTTCFWK